jgi:citrate lyase subunit beta/citryl-CoA lyase
MTEPAATAGNSGPRVKSDCLVRYVRSDTELTVSVDSGSDRAEALANAVRMAALRLRIRRGEVTVTDSGAAPFVAAARFEAAARGLMGDDLPPPRFEECLMRESEASRPRRSRLYVPGNRPRFFEKALASGADGIILDLEDSVAPARKSEARVLVAHALRALDFGDVEVMVRINQGALGLADLQWVVPQPVQHILIPKVEGPDEVRAVRDRCMEIAGMTGRGERIWLMPIVESPRGVLHAEEIAAAVPETCALTLGLQDLTAELGVGPTSHGRESFVARSLVVLAARACGLQPIDTVYSDVKNEDGLRESVRAARELGFVGKGCIHPRQVPVINEEFLPSEEELEKAKKIVLAMEKAEQQGLGAVALGTKMIDPPVARQAQNLVGNAVRLGVMPEDWRDSE